MDNFIKVGVKFTADNRASRSFANDYGMHPADARSKAAGREYFYASDIKDLKVDDFVVVMTPSHGLTVVQVTSVQPYENYLPNNHKLIVDRVDVSGYKDREEKRQRYHEIQAELTRKARAAKDRMNFKELLGDDPEAMRLLEELEGLRSFA